MISQQTALTGKRVYNGAGQAPNRGQVSANGAQGYLRRELRNKQKLNNGRRLGWAIANPKGGDGKSDMRSGQAALALRRRAGAGGKQQFQNQGRPGQGGKQQFQNQGRPVEGTKGNTGQMFNNEGRPIVGPDGQPVGAQPQTPQVIVNDAGLLELPYNDAFAQEQYAALEDANAQLLDMNNEANLQALEYTQGKRDMTQQYDQLKHQTLTGNASAGTAFSSKYGTAVAQNAQQFANGIGGLEASNTAFQQGQGQQRAAIQAALQQQIALAAQQYADELGDSAGGLGYGQAGGGQGRDGIRAGKDRRRNKRQRDRKRGNRGNR